MKFNFLAIILFLLFSFSLAYSAPALPQIIINHEKKQCADFMAGDECNACFIPDGWERLGNPLDVNCPQDYSLVIIDIECKPLKSHFCCDYGHSGFPGNCADLVLNVSEKKCAFVLGIYDCILPSGWSKKPESTAAEEWICPVDYVWANVSDYELAEVNADINCLSGDKPVPDGNQNKPGNNEAQKGFGFFLWFAIFVFILLAAIFVFLRKKK